MSRNVSDSSAVAAECQQQLESDTVTRQFQGQSYKYVRYKPLNKVTKEQRIRAVVEADRSVPSDPPRIKLDLIQQILQNGKCMFAICVHEKLKMSFLSSLLDILITDASLPLPNDYGNPHQDADTIRFIDGQWILAQPPTLLLNQFKDVIPSRTPIPIQFENESAIGSGAQGEVFQVRIDNLYHDFPAQIVDSTSKITKLSRQLALKVIPISSQHHRERDFLDHLRISQVTPHHHITQTYTGFELNGNDYLISELAIGDLKGFMYENPNARTKGLDLEWLRTQFIGLADALAKIHGPTATGLTAYHHDIKPENILVFPGTILKFTDWGCAGFKQAPGPGQSQGSFKRGQFPHLPPEHAGADAKTSRPHDVWSLACVFLEILVWFHRGGTAVTDMKQATHDQDNTGPLAGLSCWFYKNTAPPPNHPPSLSDQFVLAPPIQSELLYLHTLGPDMITLEGILSGMFTIIPGAGHRSTASEVLYQLENTSAQWT